MNDEEFGTVTMALAGDDEWLDATVARMVRPDGTIDAERMSRAVQDYFKRRGAGEYEARFAEIIFSSGVLLGLRLWSDVMRRATA